MPNEEIGGFLQFFWTSLKGLSIVETLNLLFPGLRILDLSLGPISFMGVRTPLRTEWVNFKLPYPPSLYLFQDFQN